MNSVIMVSPFRRRVVQAFVAVNVPPREIYLSLVFYGHRRRYVRGWGGGSALWRAVTREASPGCAVRARPLGVPWCYRTFAPPLNALTPPRPRKPSPRLSHIS